MCHPEEERGIAKQLPALTALQDSIGADLRAYPAPIPRHATITADAIRENQADPAPVIADLPPLLPVVAPQPIALTRLNADLPAGIGTMADAGAHPSQALQQLVLRDSIGTEPRA